jgi:hypothetical protein
VVPFQHSMLDAGLGEAVTDRETGLSGADDDSGNPFHYKWPRSFRAFSLTVTNLQPGLGGLNSNRPVANTVAAPPTEN